MASQVLFILLITPLLSAIAIAFYLSHSLWSVLLLLLGTILGAFVIGLSGIAWLQVLHRRWMESQAAGFIFLPIVLPVCAYIGALAGSVLVVILYGLSNQGLSSPLFQIAAILLIVVLSGLLPSAIVAFHFSGTADSLQRRDELWVGNGSGFGSVNRGGADRS